MTAAVLDGKALAAEVQAAIAAEVHGLSRSPGLAVILVGQDPASQVYVRNKGRAAHQLGFRHLQVDLPADATEAEVLAAIDRLNADADIDGILVQLPLPRHLSVERVMDRIDPRKDVDGITATSSGLLTQGRPRFVACTPQGVMHLLARSGVALAGAEAVVIGRSNIVGRPMVALLEQSNATVTLCHSRTRDLPGTVRRADVVIAAVGRPAMVQGDWIRDGAVVIDVGINRGADGKLIGDVDFPAAALRASAITPVPGGVGPMTIAMLMRNTLESAKLRDRS